MAVVDKAFLRGHGVVFQLLAGFLQTRCSRIGTDRAVFQLFDPFVQRGECHFVELVYTDQDIFGEDFSGKMRDDHITFTCVDTQMVTRMYTDEMILAVIDIVCPDTNIEIKDADGVDFLDFPIPFANRDMFGDGFGYAVEDAFQIMQFACILDFDEDDFAFTVQGFDVDAVELVVGAFLVAFAFEDFDDLDFFVQHDGQETVEHIEIGLLAQQTLNGPIEANIPVLQLFLSISSMIFKSDPSFFIVTVLLVHPQIYILFMNGQRTAIFL